MFNGNQLFFLNCCPHKFALLDFFSLITYIWVYSGTFPKGLVMSVKLNVGLTETWTVMESERVLQGGNSQWNIPMESS